MLTAVVTRGETITVQLVQADDGDHGEMIDISECEFPLDNPVEGEYPCDEGPSPILPEVKELAWGGGSFIVLAIAMYILFPKLKRGMDARYATIHDGFEQADTARAVARAEVAQYESSLATVKAEAAERVDAARQTLEAERSERLKQVNAEIAAQRDAANAETAAARDAVSGEIAAAVGDVTQATLAKALGRTPDATKIQAAVDATMAQGVGS